MMRAIAPQRFAMYVELERDLNFTIDQNMTVTQKADLGNLGRLPLDDPHFAEWARWVLVPDALTLEDMTGFVMPAGAFGGHEGGSV